MKKSLIIALCGMLALPAVAEVNPYSYYDEYEYWDEYGPYEEIYAEEVIHEEPAPVAQPAAQATPAAKPTPASPRAAASHASSRGTTPSPSGQRVVQRNTNPARTTTARTAVTPQSRGIVSSAAPISRASVSPQYQARATAVAAQQPVAQTVTPTAAQAAVDNRVIARAGLLQDDTINRPLYIGSGVGVAGERVALRPQGIMMSSLNQTRAASTTSTVAPVEYATEEELDLAFQKCREQYFDCMDNFCNALDENQGRCTCSVSADRHKEVEDALKKATDSLQDVAQQIQYIGLTRDEIEAIFKQTEAEAAMIGQRDTSKIKSDLDKIRKMVLDVDPNSYSTNNYSFLFNIDFSFDNGFNLYDWLLGYSGSTLRQRGAELFNTSSAKCKTAVFDQCKQMGIDVQLISTAYDLDIDRDCIAYEKILSDERDQMLRTVRNANNVLQKARLVIHQNKNLYDLRGCVNALDACMQDDFACGSDYEFCLDPTGKYIANGEVIVGSLPGVFDPDIQPAAGLFHIWNYGITNAWMNDGNLNDYISRMIKTTVNTNMVGFLQAKIGRNENGRNYGLCMSVLNQCQNYTYIDNGKRFNPENDVIRQFLVRTLTLTKARQDELIAEFAQTCIARIQSCLQVNGANFTMGYDSTHKGSVSYAAYNACRALISTCGSVTNDPDGRNIIGAAICYQGNALPAIPTNTNSTVQCP